MTASGPQVVILTGVSGSGKSTALRALEDAGFYCVDNLPIVFLEKLLELSGHTAGEVSRIALGVDAREGRFLAEAPRIIDEVRQKGSDVQVVFLDASDDALVRRYSETRRRHPLAGEGGTVPDGIAAERRALSDLKGIADEVIDTTTLNVHELKRLVTKRFVAADGARLGVTVVSFGFRFGIPTHADMVLDVRFLPNPFWVDRLRDLTGLDEPVREYVLEQALTAPFLEQVEHLLLLLLPAYVDEGKSYLTIAVGCTGGRHRSVVCSEELARRLRRHGHDVTVRHRDRERR
jgi:UPF0042 nucleotide-binding protein